MTDKRYKVRFRCPKPNCNCKVVEAVMSGVTQCSPVTDIVDWDDGSASADYGICSHGDGCVLHYACQLCGFILRDEDNRNCKPEDSAELLEWLKSHNMLEEIK